MPHIVGLAGRKQSGKSTLAAALVRDHGFQRLAFADPLRDAVRLIVAGDVVNFNFDQGKEEPFDPPFVLRQQNLARLVGFIQARLASGALDARQIDAIHRHEGRSLVHPRHALQYVGTEIVRNHVDMNFWVDCLALRLDDLSGVPGIVIDDVRMPNERDLVRARGGCVYWICRPALPPSGDTHFSERALTAMSCDRSLYNDFHDPDLWGRSASNHIMEVVSGAARQEDSP